MLRYALFFMAVMSGTTAIANDWPQWQGPDRNAASQEKGLLQEWSKDGPPLAWKANGIGEGCSVTCGQICTTGDSYGSAWLYALNEFDGKLYIRDEDMLICYDVKAK